jgi:hypothetical protein
LAQALAAIAKVAATDGLIEAGPVHLGADPILGLSCSKPKGRPATAQIATVQGRIINTSGRPVNTVAGFVESQRDGRQVSIMLHHRGQEFAPAKLKVLPAGEAVGFHAAFTSDGIGVDADRFMAEFAPFTLVLTVDGHETRRAYSVADCRQVMSGALAAIEESAWEDGPDWERE